MSKATHLRVEDCRAIVRLVGECRELGDDRNGWRLHLLEQLARLVDADAAECGETVGHREMKPRGLGLVPWGYENWVRPAVRLEVLELAAREPTICAAVFTYFHRLAREDGISLARRDFIDDREWYRSTSYQCVYRPLGMDHIVYCFRSLANSACDAYSGAEFLRTNGRRDFSARDRLIVRETHAAIASLIGGPLARFSEPSPSDLAPRVRQVLQCLLEGDGDKQVAARLKLSVHTVNQYTKAIYLHFGVNSRSELLARWIRHGWSGRACGSFPNPPQ